MVEAVKKQRRQYRRFPTRAMSQALKIVKAHGLQIAEIKVTPDGEVTITTASAPPPKVNSWDDPKDRGGWD